MKISIIKRIGQIFIVLSQKNEKIDNLVFVKLLKIQTFKLFVSPTKNKKTGIWYFFVTPKTYKSTENTPICKKVLIILKKQNVYR